MKMSSKEVQSWLLPIDENNLRCQVAGYSCLRDYLVNKGLKVCKWKETGLIKELITPDGSKMQFGRYVQYSKVGLDQTKTVSEYPKSPVSLKKQESDTKLKKSVELRASIQKKMSATTSIQRRESSYFYNNNKQLDISVSQHKRAFSHQTPNNITEVKKSATLPKTNKKFGEDTVVKCLHPSSSNRRPQSAKSCTNERSLLYPLRRTRTIYLSEKSLISRDSSNPSIVQKEAHYSPQEILKDTPSAKYKTKQFNLVIDNHSVKSPVKISPHFEKKRLKEGSCSSHKEDYMKASPATKIMDTGTGKDSVTGREEMKHPSSLCVLEANHTNTSNLRNHIRTQSHIKYCSNCSDNIYFSEKQNRSISVIDQFTEDDLQNVDTPKEVETVLVHLGLCSVSSEEIDASNLRNDLHTHQHENVYNKSEVKLKECSLNEKKLTNNSVNAFTETCNDIRNHLNDQQNNVMKQEILKTNSFDSASNVTSDNTAWLDLEVGMKGKGIEMNMPFVTSINMSKKRRMSCDSFNAPLPVHATVSSCSNVTTSSVYLTPAGSESSL